MCKLNIFCQEQDGKCNCSNQTTKIIENVKPMNGILISILDFIKSQPEIMASLVSQSSIGAEMLPVSLEAESAPSENSSPPTQTCSIDGRGDFSFKLLSMPSSKVVKDRPFSLFLEISDARTETIKLETPLTVIACIFDKVTNEEKCKLGEINTTGAVFFKKIVVSEEITEGLLVVKCKEENGILPYVQQIKVVSRKNRD